MTAMTATIHLFEKYRPQPIAELARGRRDRKSARTLPA
jgi:hypothetical protein